MSTKDFKRIFMYGVIFVIYHSCVICQTSNPTPEPHFEIMKPRGFRITLAEHPKFLEFQPYAKGVVYNEANRRVDDFDGVFWIGGKPIAQWKYQNEVIAIEPGYKVEYNVLLAEYIGKYHPYRIEAYKFVAPATEKHSQTASTTNVTSFTNVTTITNVTSSICDWSETIVQGRKVCQGELIFQDDFDGLNTSIWRRDIRIPLDIDDADFVLYRDHAENLNVTNGKLFITPKRLVDFPGFDEGKVRLGELDFGSKCTGTVNRENECQRRAGGFRILPPVVSARISTKKSFSFRYGKVEVRAQLPKGAWIFPLIVLDPLTSEYGISGYASGQMRVAFIRGNEDLKTKEGWPIDGSYLSGGVVLKPGEKDRDRWLRTVRGGEHWGNAYHTYSLIWTRSEISLAYDGKIYAILSGFNHESGIETAPFDEEFYISLGVSAGGISDFPDGSISKGVNKPWENLHPKAELHFWNARNEWFPTWDVSTASLVVDYVKVWAL